MAFCGVFFIFCIHCNFLRPLQPRSKQLLFHQASLSLFVFLCDPQQMLGVFFLGAVDWIVQSLLNYVIVTRASHGCCVLFVVFLSWSSWLRMWIERVFCDSCTLPQGWECKRMWVLSTLKCESPCKLEFLNLSNILSKIAKGKLCTNQEFFIVENVLK